VFLISTDEAADSVDSQQCRRIEDTQHEIHLLFSNIGVVMEHVVEVRNVRKADLCGLHGGSDPFGARLVERLAQVQRVGDRIQHGLRRYIRLGRVQRGRELDVIHLEFTCKIEPFFDRTIGILISNFAGSQFLQRCGEHSNLHEFRFELFNRHARENNELHIIRQCTSKTELKSLPT
jgi:hypothetical protein